jgi:nitrile hydratase
MNGIHDMGGMHGMGPIQHEANEPVFHEPWEGRAWAMVLTTGRWGRGRWGNTRYELERIPPAEYLRMSYYERWFTILVNRLLRSNLITPAELESGRADPKLPKPMLPPAPPRASGQTGPSGTARLDVRVDPRFTIGQPIRVRDMHPEGHTRLPRYPRGKRGTVVLDHGVFALQDTDADGGPLGPKPQHVFTVRFAARELWGEQASPQDAVYVDMWEDYLERS